MSAGLLASFLDCLESLPPRGTGNVHAVVANKEVAVSPVSPSPSVGETEKDQQNQGCLTCLTCLTENQPEPEQKQDVTPASPKVDAEPSEHDLINEWRSAIAAVRSDRPEIEKLKTASLRFLASPDAIAAVENGWDAVSLFGMHEGTAPKERIDAGASCSSWRGASIAAPSRPSIKGFAHSAQGPAPFKRCGATGRTSMKRSHGGSTRGSRTKSARTWIMRADGKSGQPLPASITPLPSAAKTRRERKALNALRAKGQKRSRPRTLAWRVRGNGVTGTRARARTIPALGIEANHQGRSALLGRLFDKDDRQCSQQLDLPSKDSALKRSHPNSCSLSSSPPARKAAISMCPCGPVGLMEARTNIRAQALQQLSPSPMRRHRAAFTTETSNSADQREAR